MSAGLDPISLALESLGRDGGLLGLVSGHTERISALLTIAEKLAGSMQQLHAEVAELRDELVTQEQRHRRDVDALRESIRATDRVLNDRTAHLA